MLWRKESLAVCVIYLVVVCLPPSAMGDLVEIVAVVGRNVADANMDGYGDNHNESTVVPMLIVAGVHMSGGPGCNGTMRMQFEWSLEPFNGLPDITINSASVVLTTRKGTIDSLDTLFFHCTADQDGLITNSDFESEAELIPGVIMPVIPGESTFIFDVTDLLQNDLDSGFQYFSIQGRVDELITHMARGLEVYSTARCTPPAKRAKLVVSFVPKVIAPSLDIKPGSCPNLFNARSNGVLPVALVGTDDFDVKEIDVSSVLLSRADGVGGEVAPNEGPPGPHSVFDDVATPFDGETCGCHDTSFDGIVDLFMKFRNNDVVDALELDVVEGEVELVITGMLLDGTEFTSVSDCIRLVPEPSRRRPRNQISYQRSTHRSRERKVSNGCPSMPRRLSMPCHKDTSMPPRASKHRRLGNSSTKAAASSRRLPHIFRKRR